MERLNKRISNSGYCSRREADELIFNGSVKVNDKIIKEPGYQVNDIDIVKVDSFVIKKTNEIDKVYYMLNKPTGYITSTKDDKNRKTVLSLILPVGLSFSTLAKILFSVLLILDSKTNSFM